MIPAVAFNQHARGCVKIKGQNGSQAHAIGKIEVKKLAATLGIHAESKEPDFAIVKCPSCNALVDVIGDDWVVLRHRHPPPPPPLPCQQPPPLPE